MSNRDIKKFLPPIFKTDEINNFLDSTTNKMFEGKQSERINYYIGKKSGGVYSHLTDPYAVERTKLRDDYQLEPALTVRDPQTGQVESILYYEDLLNNLKSGGSYTTDQNRLFLEDVYVFAPPIDYDMFINYRDYYWMPEGAPAIQIDATPNDIRGKIDYLGKVVSVDEYLQLTTGNHIILNDGNEYIVDGVGDSIRLQPFSLDDNVPLRVNRTFFDDTLSLYEKFPKEYITMERGAIDQNPWSRNNAWYHRDALFPPVTTRPNITIDRERRAFRPIIQFLKNIELFNYTTSPITAVDVYHSGNTLPTNTVDDVSVVAGMTAIKNNSKKMFEYDGTSWSAIADIDGKVVVTNGRVHKSKEFHWLSSWELLQQKTQNTQPILFTVYDTSDLESPTTLADGNALFTYNEDENGIYDSELQLTITQQMSGDSSDFLFSNTLREYALNVGIQDVSYKLLNDGISINDRLLTFTIGDDNGTPTMFVNGEKLPTIVVNSDTPYILEFSDSSTTGLGWFNEYFPITIIDEDGEQLTRPTHGHSRQTRLNFEYDLDGSSSKTLYYRVETRPDIVGELIVVPNVSVAPFEFSSEFKLKGTEYNKLIQRLEVTEDGDANIALEYQPLSDDFNVTLNGQDIEYTFEQREVMVRDIKKGDLLEVIYSTRDHITSTENIIQDVPTALSNNSENDDPVYFTFSDVFNHFGSVIRNQKYLVGTPLGTNNYRDTSKVITVGEYILKHTAPILPLLTVNANDEINVLDSIEHSNTFYTQYKNNIVLRVEEYMRNNIISRSNTKDVFDSIITDMNLSRQADESFSSSYMFASYRNYIAITVDSQGVIQQRTDLENPLNVLYVYTNQGIQVKNEDYKVTMVDTDYVIEPLTFTLNDITDIRYYDEVQPTFCPATPAKFGIIKPHIPVLMLDDTYMSPIIMLIGHDNSRTVAYTTIAQFNNGEIDGRDLVLLEFEKRIYNGIIDEFKQDDRNVVDYASIIPGKFRDTDVTLHEYNSLEYERFFRWSTLNQTDYTTNLSYNESDLFTYNYSSNVDKDGIPLPGHWKGIFQYYYDTTMPHIMPWIMLGFEIKPTWFDDEYGDDYSSNNTHLWEDLEEGIIRHGLRSNVESFSYLNNNPYRRIGLSEVIPVDANGKLKDPVDIGITTRPSLHNAKKPWKYGDNAPVEHAWKTLSEYSYNLVGVLYSIKPALITSRIWDTKATITSNSIHNIPFSSYNINGEYDIVNGLTQWLYDHALGNNSSPQEQMISPFRNGVLNLAHKVGGFINSDELKLYTESYNPDSNTLSTLVPPEDISILTYQSKDIKNESYSGVVVERVSASKSFYAFIDGYPYTNGDIIYSFEDNAYYKNNQTTIYPQWATGIDYTIGEEILFDNMVYVCIDNHTSDTNARPDDTNLWDLKRFDMSEWAILIQPPKNNKTEFRVYGYNIRSPYFPISVPVNGGKRKTLNVSTSKSKSVNANDWVPNQYYKRGHIVTHNKVYYEANVSHRSSGVFDDSLWFRWNTIPTVGDVRVTYSTESSGKVQMVEYGQRYRTLDEVVEFLASYGRELTNRGWEFTDYDSDVGVIKNWEFIIKEFIRWATDYREAGSAITLSPFSDTAKFKPKHGVVSLFNQYKTSAFNLLDYRSSIIPAEQINVTRSNNTFKLKSPVPIYFLRLGIREYEHSLSVNNTTIFGDSNYDPLIGVRKERLRMTGTKSMNWDGTLHAAGYLVTDSGIIPNFNTVSEEILAVNDMDNVATKDVLNELKYHNLGYQKRSYLENLEMSDKSQINFYQGFIRQKGTSEAFQRLLRSNVIDANDTLDVSEEWAFREGSFGSTYNKLQVEFNLTGNQFSYNPQLINLVYNDNQPVTNTQVTNLHEDNGNEWIMKPNRYRDNGDLWPTVKPKHRFKTAGYVHFDEHELKVPNMRSIDKIMRDSEIMPVEGLTAWVGYNEHTLGSWDVLYLDEVGTFIGEIYNHGNRGENSAVVKAYNINEEDLYIIKHPDGFYNIKFRYIKDGYYIMLSHDTDEYVVLHPNTLYSDLVIFQWKSLRIVKDELNETIKDIEEHLSALELTPTEGMLIYSDGKTFNDENWVVSQYHNGQWVDIRTPREIVDITLFNEVTAYDNNDELIDYVKIFDPIEGFIPGSMLHEIDIISDIDPVNYSDREFSHSKYTQMIGTLWLDTSEMIYLDYHQGDNEYRKTHWGSLFPYSDISVYEWTRSDVTPENYEGVTINHSDYITQQLFDDNLGVYKTYYYYWVKNTLGVSGNTNRSISANEIAQSIKYPYNNGIPLISIIDNYTLLLNDNSRRLVLNDIVIRLNYEYQHTNVQTHTQWTLLSESSDNDKVPVFIFEKMLDSIIGYDVNLQPIPDMSIPESSRYGTNQGQTWFKNLNGAREVFFKLINEFITTINIWDVNLFWERLYGGIITTTDYIDIVEWNDESFNPNTVITSIVDNRVGVTAIPLFDGEYVKVLEDPSNKPSMKNGGWTIYEYNKTDDSYKKVAQSNATFKFDLDKILNEGIPENDASNIRNILNVIFNVFAVRPYHAVINDVLFSMVRLIIAVQPNNNWVFPSTYISVRQDLLNLIPKFMYMRDREQELRDYIDEAKPYHTKLREFNKINNPEDEYVAIKVTDFDKPPYIDQDKNFFILQEQFIDTVRPIMGEDTYTLNYSHTSNIRVSIGETMISPDRYIIVGRRITLLDVELYDRNYVESIIVASDNMIQKNIINTWNPTYGYKLLDSDRSLENWEEFAINKDIQIDFDRTAYTNNVGIDTLVDIHEYAYNETITPLAYIESKSDVDNTDYNELIHEVDRVLIHANIDTLKDINDDSRYFAISHNETYILETPLMDHDTVVLINNKLINVSEYSIYDDGDITVYRFKFELVAGDYVSIHPKKRWLDLMSNVTRQTGLNVPGDSPIMLPENSNFEYIDIGSKVIMNETTMTDDDILAFTHDDSSEVVVTSGTFGNEGNQYPEELSKLVITESMIFMSLNQMPPLVKMGYAGFNERDVQDTITHTIVSGVTSYPADITVPAEQVKVIIDNDVLIPSVDYAVFSDRIDVYTEQVPGKTLIITDLYVNFDPNYHNNIKRIKNINGGYDSYVFDYSKWYDAPLTREFIVYDMLGRVFHLVANEEAFLTVSDKPNSGNVEIVLDDNAVNSKETLFAIVGFDEDESFDKVNYEYEIVRGKIVNGTITNMTRGLFNDSLSDFTNSTYVRVYELKLKDDLDEYVIQEAIVGITGRNSYPKYGSLFK